MAFGIVWEGSRVREWLHSFPPTASSYDFSRYGFVYYQVNMTYFPLETKVEPARICAAIYTDTSFRERSPGEAITLDTHANEAQSILLLNIGLHWIEFWLRSGRIVNRTSIHD